jgi:hypothetical protein
MVKKGITIKFLAAGLLLAGLVQADIIQLTSSQFLKTNQYTGNLSWQEIQSVTCSFNDDGDKILEVGENVTFTVTMAKDNWGTHNYDALKVWVDKLPGIESPYYGTQNFVWDYNGATDYNGNSAYSYKDWAGGTMSFSYSVKFLEEGDFGFAASVMCSRDLSGLNSAGTPDVPVSADWAAWNPNAHQNKSWLQGEDEWYKLTVSKSVPEPTLISLLGCGLLGLVFVRRRK